MKTASCQWETLVSADCQPVVYKYRLETLVAAIRFLYMQQTNVLLAVFCFALFFCFVLVPVLENIRQITITFYTKYPPPQHHPLKKKRKKNTYHLSVWLYGIQVLWTPCIIRAPTPNPPPFPNGSWRENTFLFHTFFSSCEIFPFISPWKWVHHQTPPYFVKPVSSSICKVFLKRGVNPTAETVTKVAHLHERLPDFLCESITDK